MRAQRVAQTAVTGRVRVEPVFGEELLAARAKDLVDESAGADSFGARGWVGGSGFAALIRSTAKSKHRLQDHRDPRNNREVDQPAHHRLDSRLIERVHDCPQVALKARERRRMNRVVRADGNDRKIGRRGEHRWQLSIQDVGDPRPSDGEPGEMHPHVELRGRVGHEHLTGVIQARAGQRTVADDGNLHWLRHVDPCAPSVSGVPVVTREVEIIEVRERRLGGPIRLPPAASDYRRNCEYRPPGSHKTTHRGDLPTERQ